MQIIGLCRFSYPAIGGFQVGHDSIEARMDYLWAPERLEERFRLFEAIALPCLRAQTDPDFDLLVLIGDQMPKPHVDRLHDLTSDMPQVRIVAEPPAQARQITKELLNRGRRDPKAPCFQFRYDDDDACAVDFFEKLRGAAQAAAPWLAQYRTVGLDWAKGYIAEVSAQGIAAQQVRQPFSTAALAMYVRGNCPLSIYNFAHHRLPMQMPCMTFSDLDMFVRTHNQFNDSRQTGHQAIAVEPLTTEQETLFKARFAIDVAEVRRVFSAP
ncbi:MAG: putative rhamnosyl transferase [Pseudomonadota bacterium]